ncbi:hypothetical protein ACRS6Y_12640 [Bacillus cytotoxicus]|uniref:Uncharacterized protein n=1 Tax=Bacillus cytotoxicus (strain DSM 22905 / CIP 110041 / 391-98 / NVH 391-98) TaxID=315749 RepID=A7GPG7_BACCN|nr:MULTISPECIES: hypothetical protein [Bacillus cereus group]ABS22025.1 conserved hypothetical protein [Bacillus cytotoxicus NVH 391-98]AWC28627.1 hypothetical protein CG483_009770 [Bacillus cytotoxicus]AWC32650.1 hypothetical protein CG482_009585 [Bacillus cytotoxicus]AWC36678.1 hypothetical protein CG481_009595 [Bacillus cytotoxicus]AWC39989.1 hypothetical protein CG480_005485 [Bacillus cytotoxicus]
MYTFPARITVAAPMSPSTHVASIHAGTSDVGVALPTTWQHYQSPWGATPSFWQHNNHSTSSSGYHYPFQIFYHFPSIYFQNFYGTFNI